MPDFIKNSPFLNDPIGNTIAIITLLVMITSAIGVIFYFQKNQQTWIDRLPEWLIPVLAGCGIIVAAYLFFIEFSNATPYCGPVGECSKVQNSPYSYVFGFIPVGLLGVVGYSIILILWIITRFIATAHRDLLLFGIWVISWFGILFSIYLTFLEPFVIGATCLWCISSAIIMTLLLWTTTGRARRYWTGMADDIDS